VRAIAAVGRLHASNKNKRGLMQTEPPIGIAKSVLLDQTKSEQYDRLVTEELEHYDEVTVTEGLTEGGVHSRAGASISST
jgi:hypothetical protein